ncbi:acyltransferase [Kiritimatiella glycovorans]|uniref:Galactoside O-acetyltransferase n=1 Tax=Kiritimatiella glycovorans TaxID=1307763 RepID=A0A0G3EBS3_9BACT|nr:acyltransferase [Kiritimatiella glycovorans]AKJ63906.1 Galactoside O-acetyltransferase [Kiritimatiella glycovorans]
MKPTVLASGIWHMLLGYVHLRRCTRVGRRPRVYGRPAIINRGSIEIGERFLFFSTTVRSELITHPGGRIAIGDRVFLNYGASLSAHEEIRIGNGCQIGSYACLMDNDYHRVEDRNALGESKPIVLEDNVWLGVRVIVLKGVTIGKNAVIGAGSVVTKDVPPNSLAAGAPARVVRTFGAPEEARES